jgi:hypothetical protein
MEKHLFPHPILSKIHEPGHRPTRERVLETIRQVNTNAASVTTFTLGAPGSGLIGLTISAADYLAKYAVAWTRPAQPSNTPTCTATDTQFVIAEARAQHTEAWRQYNIMLQSDTALRNQLLVAADEVYYAPLFDQTTGYGTRTTRDFIAHLETKYAAFDEATRTNVTNKMDVPWAGGPFEYVIAQITQGRDSMAQNGHDISDKQMCDKLYSLVSRSGLLREACQQWRLLAEASKTWAACQAHFQLYADDRHNDATTGTEGYHGATAALAQAQAIRDAVNQAMQPLVAAANLARETQGESGANTTIAELRAQAAVLQAQVTTLQTLANRNGNGRGGGGGGGDRNRGRHNNPARTMTHYCWTHAPTCPTMARPAPVELKATSVKQPSPTSKVAIPDVPAESEGR